MGYKDCPCKGCKRRYTLCHSSCKEYKEWKAKIDEIKQKKIEEHELEYALWSVKGRSIKNTLGNKWKEKDKSKRNWRV